MSVQHITKENIDGAVGTAIEKYVNGIGRKFYAEQRQVNEEQNKKLEKLDTSLEEVKTSVVDVVEAFKDIKKFTYVINAVTAFIYNVAKWALPVLAIAGIITAFIKRI